jgi:hypothetical protein
LSKTNFEKFSENNLLLISLFIITFGVLLSNLVGEEVAILFGNWVYFPITGAVVVLAMLLSIRHGFTGNHGKAWIFFTACVISWFIAEALWTVNELVFEIDPYPSNADYFYLLGYPLYFGFTMFYLRPFRKIISKKIIVSTSIFSITILIPSLLISTDFGMDLSDSEVVLAAIYPVLDGIVLVPALIGIVLFLRGQVNFLWAALCTGILCDIIADLGFLYLSLEETYYTGHPIDILYLFSYVFFAFGTYHHIKLFKKEKISQDKL